MSGIGIGVGRACRVVGGEVRQVHGDDNTLKRTVVAIFIILSRLFAFFFILVTHFGARLGPILLFFCIFVNSLGRAFLLA